MKVGDKTDGACTVCSKEVKRIDSAVHIESFIEGHQGVLLMASARHIACSPSRAQFIVHEEFPEVIDERAQYSKFNQDASEEEIRENEAIWTNAWANHVATCNQEEK